MSFEENVKKWVNLDNQLKVLGDRTKQVRDERNDLEDNIMEYAIANNLKNATINISDGKLRFVATKQTAPLTLKYVEECLGKCIGNATQVQQIMQVIKESRETKYVDDIKRYQASKK
jgi:hypothetical protein